MSTSIGSKVNKNEVSALSCLMVKAILTTTASRLGMMPRERDGWYDAGMADETLICREDIV